MEQEKYQVFISSPFHGLADQRKAAQKAVIMWEHIPTALENFSPQVQRDFDVIRKSVGNCQIYILILGHGYGSIIEDKELTKGRDISYTQFEYEEAIEKGLVPLVFLKNYDVACKEIDRDKNIEDKGIEKKLLKKFHELIKKQGIFYKPWDTDTNFEAECSRALINAIIEEQVRLPGWIRAGEGKDTMRVQMALKNVFVLDMINSINSFGKLDERCGIDVDEKETLARYIRETFLNTLINKKFSLFFESDSCPAFVAKELGNTDRFSRAILNSQEEDGLNLYTNNVLAFLQLWMNDHLPVLMLPKSSPKEQYGASYGVLDELIDEDVAPNYGTNRLDEHTRDAIRQLAESGDAISTNEKILLICSISGVQIKDKHTLATRTDDDELKNQIEKCYGFHAGSYKNIVFKRYLYSTNHPVMITMTSSEIDMEIAAERCHFVFDEEYTWESFYREHPLAFCIGCKIERRDQVVQTFQEMGFEVISKPYEKCAAVLASNEEFRKKVPLE